MPTVFDCEDRPNKFMECPCQCDCGKWFDREDGYPSRGSELIVCRECHENEIREDDDIYDFEN